jgi:cell division protein ZapA
MSKITLTLHNRDYTVNCGPGEEDRLREVAAIVESEMQAVADRVGNSTEPRHLMLTCLSLADKLLELKSMSSAQTLEHEQLFVAAVDHLKQRVEHLASQIGRA